MWWPILAACTGAGDGGTSDDVEPVSTADTGPVVPSIVASCDLQDGNGLRVVCQVDLEQAGPAELTLQPEDGSEDPRTFVSSVPSATDHEIVGWDLVGDTRYTWTISSAGVPGPSGTLRTQTAPSGVTVSMDVLVDNGPSSIDRLLIPYACGGDANLVVMDGKGRVRWYDGPFSAIGINGINVSDRGSFLAVLSRSRVVEYALDGTILLDLKENDGDLPQAVHHDVAAKHGRTAVLTARAESFDDGNAYVMDGVYEIDASGVLDEWNVGEVLDPRGVPEPQGSYWQNDFGGAIDFGHANAIEIDDGGGWLVSFKHLDTIMAIEDGQVRWSIAGGSRALAPGTLTLGSSVGIDASFEYQHNLHWTEQGTLMLVDNGRDGGDWTRILEIAVDEVAKTADVIAEYVLEGARCPIQSSGYRLDDGTLVASCTSNRHLYEFEASGALRREVVLNCPAPGSLQATLVRAIPVEL